MVHAPRVGSFQLVYPYFNLQLVKRPFLNNEKNIHINLTKYTYAIYTIKRRVSLALFKVIKV